MSDREIPAGWQIVPLSELLAEQSDLTYGVVQPGQSTPGGVPIIRVKDIRKGRIATEDLLLISPDIERQYQRSRIKGGELLVTLVGTVGETAIASDEQRGWNTARAVATVRLPALEYSHWVSYCIQSPEGQERIRSRVNTTVQTTLNLKDLREFPVLLPPLNERRAIAGILGVLDDKIESTRRLARVSQDLARAEFASAISSNAQRLPLADLLMPVHDRGQVIVHSSPYVGLEHFDGFDLALWNFGVAEDSKSASKVAQKGDLLFGRIRPYFGNVALVGREAVVAQSVEVLRAKKREFREVSYLGLSSREFIETATTLSHGTTMPQVKWSDLSRQELSVPTNEDILDLHQRLSPLFELIEILPKEFEHLACLRTVMLSELMSGRLRVRDAESMMENV